MNCDQILQLFIDNIGLWLSLSNIRAMNLLNSNYRKLLSRDGFWKHKIFIDFRIREEKEDQTWLERYQLATYMNRIFLKHAGEFVDKDANKWIKNLDI